LFRQKIRRGLAPYYGIGASLAACLVALAAGRPDLALAAGAIWAALTAHFCWRRLKDTSRAPSHVAEMIVTSILIPPLALLTRVRGAARYRVLYL
jgi:hypothetical protein